MTTIISRYCIPPIKISNIKAYLLYHEFHKELGKDDADGVDNTNDYQASSNNYS